MFVPIKLLLVTLMLAIMAKETEAIQCYVCATSSDSSCADEGYNNTASVTSGHNLCGV